VTVKGGNDVPEPQTVNPYWLERRWNAVKRRFEDLRQREEGFAYSLLAMEEQVGFMALHHPDLTSTDIAQAYMLAGLHVAAATDPELRYRFAGFTEPVAELARRCLATCHPDFNPDVAAAAEQIWGSDEDRRFHFNRCGAVLRRLVDSAQFWARRGSRAYVQVVTDLLHQSGWQPQIDKINFTVCTKQPIA
jgi:hypothetical protein